MFLWICQRNLLRCYMLSICQQSSEKQLFTPPPPQTQKNALPDTEDYANESAAYQPCPQGSAEDGDGGWGMGKGRSSEERLTWNCSIEENSWNPVSGFKGLSISWRNLTWKFKISWTVATRAWTSDCDIKFSSFMGSRYRLSNSLKSWKIVMYHYEDQNRCHLTMNWTLFNTGQLKNREGRVKFVVVVSFMNRELWHLLTSRLAHLNVRSLRIHEFNDNFS